MICEYFKDVREKYVKQYYYNRPGMMKFIEVMNTHSSKERFRYMMFLKMVFKLYAKLSNCITNFDDQYYTCLWVMTFHCNSYTIDRDLTTNMLLKYNGHACIIIYTY